MCRRSAGDKRIRILERELERKGQEHAPGEEEEAGEEEQVPDRLLGAPAGLATVSIEEAGKLRMVTRPIDYEGRRVGTLHVADPLTPVEDAQESLRRTFAVAGSLALLLAVAAGVWIATLIARPLRRMAGVAAAVDSGDLSRRAGSAAARGGSARWPLPSTACWSGSSAPSSASATSSRTPRMSCARRSRWCEHRSSCSTARPTSAHGTKAQRGCCGASMSSTGWWAT